ncbi:MAG: hypothetical protein IAC55_08030 [Tyzzerella sp.]|uniref:Thioredoxin domain-containing protein n=1 Tax=Candidatus Fimicola merdigallinarum TaxID=2840819 RepID=A0A9D9DZV3_9FIRM|nr:hypothetical protein [Candidatus Fimicola merdigallinarum]
MKKTSVFFLLVLVLAFSMLTGCSSSSKNKPISLSEEERTTTVDELGLIYTLPEEWTVNTIKYTSLLPDSDIFGEVKFVYGSEENLEIVSDPNFTGNTEYFTTPIARIVLVKTGEEGADFEALKSEYNEVNAVGENCGYTYYVMYDYKGGLGKGDDDIAEYEKRVSASPKLVESIKFKEFNPEDTTKQATDKQNMITFVSKTLEGAEIGSTIFDEYDLTMVNFWGTYIYPDIDDTQALVELDKYIKTLDNVNFLQVIIDTPATEAEDLALRIKTENGGEYTSVIPDKRLANWIVNNLEVIPTTVFVNNDAVVVGDYIQGTKTADEYISLLNAQLEKLKTEVNE